jgi:anaerobic ribonucleoside-triphosphate reductase activating protein
VTIRVHAVEPSSLGNGPGMRAVLWVQGCSINCTRCWNRDTHDPTLGEERNIPDLVDDLLEDGSLGLTVSGGEPLDQADSVGQLIQMWLERAWPLYHNRKDLCMNPEEPSVIVFSGYSIGNPVWQTKEAARIWRKTDVLIAGPYTCIDRPLLPGYEMSSCATQITYNLTYRLQPRTLWQIPRAECIVHLDGSVVLTGTDPDLAK